MAINHPSGAQAAADFGSAKRPSPGILRIDVLGTVINISTDEDGEYLEKLLEKYRQTIENVQRLSGISDPLKTAVLTGFLLCDDLEKAGGAGRKAEAPSSKSGLGEQAPEEHAEAERLTLRMISRLEEVVGENDEKTSPFPASPSVYKLQNTVKNYDWGSPEWLPSLMGQENPARIPWAELWMGVNAAGPSRLTPAGESKAGAGFTTAYSGAARKDATGSTAGVGNAAGLKDAAGHSATGSSAAGIGSAAGQKDAAGSNTARNTSGSSAAESAALGRTLAPAPLLSELIDSDREAFLGKAIAGKFGKLPFLFKVIAVAKPLSIQAHPPAEQATEGFERENACGIPITAPARNYRDASHKPELLCALSPFAALCGFRKKEEISLLLGKLASVCHDELKAELEKLIAALGREDDPYRAFLSTLFNMDGRGMGTLLIKRQALLDRDFPEYRGEWKLCSYLASQYPDNTGILAPFFMNIIELKPGEAFYVPPGILHAYLYGLGMELMADSDNVIRAGLTGKHVDREELLRILDFSAFNPEIIKAPDPSVSRFSYPPRYEEFCLSVFESRGESVPYSENGPSIVLLTRGRAAISEGGEKLLELKAGESAFIPAGKSLKFSGNFIASGAACRYS